MNAPLPPPTTWTTGTTEVFRTGTWRAALPHHVHAPSPCHQACPVGGDIAEWIALARARDFRAAFDVLTRHNPFPAVAGRVCHHPCEAACNRAGYDEPLAICKLERLVGDRALEQGWRYPAPERERAQRVAIVGAGPSGLSAAFQLRRRGYRVALYEARPEAGGVMRYGIPAYRLSRAVLDGEIDRILALGIEWHGGAAVSTPAQIDALRTSHDALYLATGAGRPKRLAQLPAAAPWLMDGADYLAQANAGAPPALGRHVVVVGGGSAAIDVARSARRAGHQVSILALEGEAQMPAQREEVAEALEEGIALVAGSMIDQVVAAGGGIELRCVRVRFEAGAARGEFRVSAEPDSAFSIAADAVVSAIGQDPELDALSQAFARQGALLAVDADQATSVERIWAGGDLASMARFITEAVGMGQRAALRIHQALSGEAPDEAPAGSAVGLPQIATWYHEPRARAAEALRAVGERLADSAEVQLPLDLQQALDEASRCFSCGSCVHCDNCVNYCPDLAVVRVDDGYRVLTDYCKGCGVCVRECPTGSMVMREEVR